MVAPIWDHDLLIVGEFGVDTIGSSVYGGRSMSGVTRAIDMSGGGIWQVRMNRVFIQTVAGHQLWNKMAAILNGGVNPVTIPFHTDNMFETAPEGDLIGPYNINEGTVTIEMSSGDLEEGMIFSIDHGGTLDHRCYRVTEIDSQVGDTYTVGIRPTLRAEITSATGDPLTIDFDRPRCTMCLPPDQTMEWYTHGWRLARPDVTFVEFFSNGS